MIWIATDWKDGDKIRKVNSEDIPKKVSLDKAYQNAMKNSDKQNARIEHDSALRRVILELLFDHNELYKQFSDNPAFKKWLAVNNGVEFPIFSGLNFPTPL